MTTPYFYLPIPAYGGLVLKCAGMVTADNNDWFCRDHPDAVVMPEYLGDRITLDGRPFGNVPDIEF